MLFTTIFTTLLAATASIAAPTPAPTQAAAPQELIVFSPHITYPVEAVAWPKGSKQVVKWDTTGLPDQTRNSTGLILLGYMKNGSENLDIAHPVAKGFPMGHGAVEITVPGVAPRNDYFLVLFGDSGNKSPKFVIH